MPSIVRILRSESVAEPTVLGQGQLAYSSKPSGSGKLWIGMGAETAGDALNHLVIGGELFTDEVTAATPLNTVSTIVKRDASGDFAAGSITAALLGNASTATAWAAARDLSLTGDATATLSSVDGTANVSTALTLATVNSNVGAFGSISAIPSFTVNAKGLITAVTTYSPTVTIGTTAIGLDGTSTVLAGLTQLTVDDIDINGNTISTTGSNLDVILAPHGTGKISVSSALVSDGIDPVGPQDLATKAYVDSVASGITDVKLSVRAATTANITLSGEQTIDGVSVVADDRVLVKDQTAGEDNGIYVASAGAWARSSDADTSADVTSGMFTFVSEGTAHGSNGFVLTTPDTIILDTTSLTFTQFSGAGTYLAGDGILLTGSTFSAVGTTDRISVGVGGIDIATGYVGQTSITTLGTIGTGAWNADTIGPTKGGTGLTTYTAGDILYASASNTLAARAMLGHADGQVLQLVGGLPDWGDVDGGTF